MYNNKCNVRMFIYNNRALESEMGYAPKKEKKRIFSSSTCIKRSFSIFINIANRRIIEIQEKKKKKRKKRQIQK